MLNEWNNTQTLLPVLLSTHNDGHTQLERFLGEQASDLDFHLANSCSRRIILSEYCIEDYLAAMSITLEHSRPKLMMLEDEDILLNGSSDLNDIADSDSPPAIKSTFDPKTPVNDPVQLNPIDEVSQDVEMEDFSGTRSDLPEEEDMDVQISRLQAKLFREESKLILLKKIFHLQNAPPKVDKKEESLVERKGQPAGKTGVSGQILQNGIKHSKSPADNMKNDKLAPRDSRMQSILKGGPAINNQRSSAGNQSGGAGIAELSRSLAQKPYKNSVNQNAGAGNYNSRNQNPPTPQNKPQQNPADQMEQQLSSERSSLKRQMERSVLQIAPPRPPVPDLNFIPATVCPDFIALLGMELSVNYAINSKNLIDLPPYLEPHLCAKCGEDVCPAWKIDKESGVVVCEPCYITFRSNAARASHIENLRKAFSSVLEKGKELDRQQTTVMVDLKPTRPAQKAVPSSPPVYAGGNQSSGRSQNNNQNNSSSPYRGGQKAAANSNYAARPSLPPAPSSRNSAKPQTTSPYAHMTAPLPYAPTSSQKHSQTFGNPLQGIRHPQDINVQRQYLLDLISRSPKQQANQQWRK